MIRTGFGYDLHRLVKRRRLWIGGVDIPSKVGELAHSDGDVLIHSCIDALLGAAGLRDIGTFFPPTDPAYRNISSRRLLQQIMLKLKASGWQLVNLDATVILERPRLGPFIEQIIATLAADLDVKPARIGVKAKTKEKVGLVGRGKAIEAYAVVLLEK